GRGGRRSADIVLAAARRSFRRSAAERYDAHAAHAAGPICVPASSPRAPVGPACETAPPDAGLGGAASRRAASASRPAASTHGSPPAVARSSDEPGRPRCFQFSSLPYRLYDENPASSPMLAAWNFTGPVNNDCSDWLLLQCLPTSSAVLDPHLTTPGPKIT